MTSTIGRILPVAAAVRASNRAAGRRSFVLLCRPRGAVQSCREWPRRGGRPAGRPRCALRPELLGMARRLLRHRQDRRGPDPGQCHVDAGRGPVRRRGLRDSRRAGIGGRRESRCSSSRSREPPGRRPVGRRDPAGATAFADWLADGRPEFSPAERDGGDLAAICYTSGTTGRPKGAMQRAPRRHRGGRRHGRHGGTWARRPRHQLAAAAARLRIVRVQRRRDGRLDADHDSALRCGGRPARDRRRTARH